MASISGDKPISGDAPLTGAELGPALAKIKGAFSSLFPGKTVEDLTVVTKLSPTELDKILNFEPPTGLSDAQTKKLTLQNKADIEKLEKLTGMSHDKMRGILKNAETLDDVMAGVETSLRRDPHTLHAILATDGALRDFLTAQIHVAADKRYVTGVTGSWLKKKLKAAKGKEVKDALGVKLQDAKVFEALKKPFADLQAALKQPKLVAKPASAPAPSTEMELHRAKLTQLQVGQTLTAAPRTDASQESASPAASPKPATEPATPSTTTSKASLYARFGFVSTPASSAPTTPSTTTSKASQYEKYGFGAPDVPVHVPTNAEIARDIKDFSRAYLTLENSIRALEAQKPGMTKAEDRAAIDQIIKETKERIENLQNRLFDGVQDLAVLDRLDNECQAKIEGLMQRQQAGESVQDQLDACYFVLRAIKSQRDAID